MAISNKEIAEMFNQTADYLSIKQDNPFRIRAYRRAANTIASLDKNLSSLLDQGEDLSLLPNIGKDLSAKIAGIIHSGEFGLLEDLKKEIPAGLIDLLSIRGLGPKRVSILRRELHIENPDDLKRAALKGKIKQLPGFGEKTQAMILNALRVNFATEKRLKWSDADLIANKVVSWLQQIEGIKRVTVAGSYRRKKDTVSDLDILVTSRRGASVIEAFLEYEQIAKVISKGTTRSSVELKNGFQIDLRVVPESSYGAALHYFTGSKAHSIDMREIAIKGGCKINEYGVYKNGKAVAGKTEKGIYQYFGLQYIEPELREMRGEIPAARAHRLPNLIEVHDMKGDLHLHTNQSDGQDTLQAMVERAVEKGYAYVAITEHSKRIKIAGGLNENALRRQCEKIDALNEKLKKFVVLKSVEVDILENGALDLKDSALSELDLTVCAVHNRFDLSAKRQTDRIIRAMDNPYFSILAHPTGRLLGRRKEYQIEMERIIQAAKERGCVLEINAQPERLDLNDIYCKMAKEAGVGLAISTDAHSRRQMDYMEYGIMQARRGWLEAGDVINTLAVAQLKKKLKRG